MASKTPAYVHNIDDHKKAQEKTDQVPIHGFVEFVRFRLVVHQHDGGISERDKAHAQITDHRQDRSGGDGQNEGH